MSMDLVSLKKKLGSGLLAFPVTHFKPDLTFDEQPYRRSIHDNIQHGAAGLFAPGGTGEFFSLTIAEVERVTRAAVEEAKGRLPIVGGTGYGTAMSVEFAKAAERAGADAVLVLPPYLVGVEQAGLEAHVDAICKAIGIGVIVYNRDNAIYSAETVARLVDRHQNMIGYKDGHGDVEQLVRVRRSSATASSTSGECPPQRFSPSPTLRRASRPTPPPSSTSSPKPQCNSSTHFALASTQQRTACCDRCSCHMCHCGTVGRAMLSASLNPACVSSDVQPVPCGRR